MTDHDLPRSWSSKSKWLFHRALALRHRCVAGERLEGHERGHVAESLAFGDVNYASEDDDDGARARLFVQTASQGTDRQLARLACAHEALWATYDALERGPRLAVEDTCSDDDLLPEDLDEVF